MQRRNLRFSALTDVKADLLNLHTNRYTKTGKWDLSQVSEHVSDWMSFPMDGFPKMPLIVKLLIGTMRVTRGRALYEKFAEHQRMRIGQPTMPQTLHLPNTALVGELQSINRFINLIDRLADFRGPLHPSPLFGALTYEELVALQLTHSAHHLSFLVPLERQ